MCMYNYEGDLSRGSHIMAGYENDIYWYMNNLSKWNCIHSLKSLLFRLCVMFALIFEIVGAFDLTWTKHFRVLQLLHQFLQDNCGWTPRVLLGNLWRTVLLIKLLCDPHQTTLQINAVDFLAVWSRWQHFHSHGQPIYKQAVLSNKPTPPMHHYLCSRHELHLHSWAAASWFNPSLSTLAIVAVCSHLNICYKSRWTFRLCFTVMYISTYLFGCMAAVCKHMQKWSAELGSSDCFCAEAVWQHTGQWLHSCPQSALYACELVVAYHNSPL